MKNFIKILSLCIIGISLYSASFAENYWRWWSYWTSPMSVFEEVVDKANDWRDPIQETALDGITDLQWSYAQKYKITNTLDYIRQQIDPYMQRTAYIWLVFSTIWLIVAWFLMVTWWINKSWDISKQKTRIINALVWVFLLSWFYLILKLFVSVINSIFWNSTWWTGF